mgnify:FL=1|tara:strand:- start:395 stop:1162 length:768 start_codon:yes stop_codon:yes gene_type:complete
MKIYFNANNKAHLEALHECGVKNVMLSFRYSYANIDKFRDMFDSIFIVAGTKSDPDKYHEFLKKKKELYDYATQFDVFYNMKETMAYLNKERDIGIDWTLPVLQENYLNHLSLLRPKKDDYVCLGEVHGKLETEDQIRKLPRNVRYHGLAKGKYLEKRLFDSLDTSGWISAAMSKKCEVWNGSSTYSMFFGEKGKNMKPQLQHALEMYSDNLEKVNIQKSDVLENEYYSLLKISFPILYIPMCKRLGIYEENFIN